MEMALHPRYRTAMNLNLATERLLLTPFAESDLDIAIEILTDPDVMKYVDGVFTEERVVEEMPMVLRRAGGGCIGIWCVTERATETKIGTAVILPLPIEERDTNWDLVQGPDIPEGEMEIGYLLKKSAWGKGYATEITKRLVTFAFEDTPLEEVVAVTDLDNMNSRKVLTKAGLIYEGHRRAYASDDCTSFRLTKQRWLEQTRKNA